MPCCEAPSASQELVVASTQRSAAAPDTLVRLREALAELYLQAGTPSQRELARRIDKQRTGRRLTHPTIGAVLRCETTPRWETLELVVEALEGDAGAFHPLWKAARSEGGRRPD